MDPSSPSAEVYGLALGSTNRKRDQPNYKEKDHLDLMTSNPLKLVNFPIDAILENGNLRVQIEMLNPANQMKDLSRDTFWLTSTISPCRLATIKGTC